jgi:hypothetical protein
VDEVRMQRRLPIVDMPFRHDADQIVGVEIDRIGVGRRNVRASLEPAQDRPWPGPEKILAVDSCERGLKPDVVDLRERQNLPGVGRPDDGEFVLPVHRMPFVPAAFRPGHLSSFIQDLAVLGWCAIKHIAVC